MDYCQRAEELEYLCKNLLYGTCLSDTLRRAYLLKIDSAGMNEEELIDKYGGEVAELIMRDKYYDAYLSLERNKNESYSE